MDKVIVNKAVHEAVERGNLHSYAPSKKDYSNVGAQKTKQEITNLIVDEIGEFADQFAKGEIEALIVQYGKVGLKLLINRLKELINE